MSIKAKSIYSLMQLMKRAIDPGKTEDQTNPYVNFNVNYPPFYLRKRLHPEF